MLVADKKEMVAVDLNMYSFVMPNVPCQPNELVFTTIKFNLISWHFPNIILPMSRILSSYTLLFVLAMTTAFLL